VGTEKKSQADKVIVVQGPSVEMKGYLIWQNHFQIPDLPPNPLAGCKIMELQYYLEVSWPTNAGILPWLGCMK